MQFVMDSYHAIFAIQGTSGALFASEGNRTRRRDEAVRGVLLRKIKGAVCGCDHRKDGGLFWGLFWGLRV